MNFKQAQALEYALSIFPTYFLSKGISDVPKYSIVWSMKNRLMFANTFKKNGKESPIYEYERGNGEILTVEHSISSNTDFVGTLRKRWFEKYGAPFFDFKSLYGSPVLLLENLRKDYSDFNVGQSEDTNILYNVQFVENSAELPFLIIPDENQIEPVSLVVEN